MSTITLRLSLTLLLGVAFTAAEAQQGPPLTAMPERPEAKQLALPEDPLEASTAHCDFNAPQNKHVKLDYSQVAANRRLRRQAYRDTDIRALKPGSQHWVTGCPVKLERGAQWTPVCTSINVFEPANGGSSVLRIAQAGSKLVFKIENTQRGLIRGELVRKTNPHGGQEEVWLESRNVTRNGMPENFFYYVFLRDNNLLKYYQVEVFDPSDVGCMNAHLPKAATLCINAATAPKTCVLPSPPPVQFPESTTARAVQQTTGSDGSAMGATTSRDESRSARSPVLGRQHTFRSEKDGVRGKGNKQGDTGAGHEPPPVDN